MGVKEKKEFQLELDLMRPFEEDRNFSKGGRSFYFFDFDDNVIFLTTPIILFEKDSGLELAVSSGDFARESHNIGLSGRYKNFFVDLDDLKGSFRHFRDLPIRTQSNKQQPFVEDIRNALENCEHSWKAPSWNFFHYATYNKRPVSIITARGHQIQTIKKGIDVFVQKGHLPHRPNYLGIYPVSNKKIKKDLRSSPNEHKVPELKRLAIRSSVERAIEKYGYNPHHRFGMSDDDPSNIELISAEMRELKKDYPEMSFFVISTVGKKIFKTEIFRTKTKSGPLDFRGQGHQLPLFGF